MSHWKKVSPANLKFSCYNITVYNQEAKSIFAFNLNGLFEYNYFIKDWKQHDIVNKLPDSYFNTVSSGKKTSRHPVAINSSTNTIYFLNQTGSMTILNLNHKDKKWETKNTFSMIGGAEGIVFNNEYHIIGGYPNFNHLKYNEETNKLEVVHNLSDAINVISIVAHRLIIIGGKLTILGGHYASRAHGNTRFDFIHQYDDKNNQWQTLKSRMPHRLSSFGCTKILYDQYLVILGGRSDDGKHDDIWLYSVRDMTFKKSNIKCPKKSAYRAFTINDRKRDEMTTFGYVRDRWKQCEIDNHLFPPRYLIGIMHKYYLNEEIHLFQRITGKHWRIDAVDIIANCSYCT